MENKLPDLIYEQLKINPPENRRILSIQSHVVHGYAGNKCSIFPMQLHGYEVDPINCVQYSNHSAYKFMKGQKLDSVQLSNIYEGLKLNQINSYSHVLTGYCSNISFLKEVVNIVKDLKQKNPDILFYCDPVLGDNGRYYVPEEMMPVYRDILVPLADLISPNIFELSMLSGQSINNEQECLEAINLMHKCGVKTVVVSSGLETATTEFCYGSVCKGLDDSVAQYRFDIPVLPGVFVGTGDVFVSLLLVWMDKLKGDIEMAIQNVIGTLQAILQRTTEKAYHQRDPKKYHPTVAELELQLVQSRIDILYPQIRIKSTRLQ